jgi:hypothetical protein
MPIVRPNCLSVRVLCAPRLAQTNLSGQLVTYLLGWLIFFDGALSMAEATSDGQNQAAGHFTPPPFCRLISHKPRTQTNGSNQASQRDKRTWQLRRPLSVGRICQLLGFPSDTDGSLHGIPPNPHRQTYPASC